MISSIVTLGMICLLMMSGRVFQAIKHLIVLLFETVLKLLKVFGIAISYSNNIIRMPKEFYLQHQEIKSVRKSTQNIKLKPSINVAAAVISSLVLFLIVLNYIYPDCCVLWLWQIIPDKCSFLSYDQLSITYTAIMFSTLSFSISTLINQWKSTKEYRVAKKQIKERKRLLYSMGSKEILEVLKEKDTETYNNLKE